MAERVGIHANVDTRELRKDLEALSAGLGRELDAVWRDVSAPLASETRRLAPYDPAHRADRSDDLPHIRDTIAVRVTAATAAIVSDHPAAPVWEWTGHIEPRGTRIDIPPPEGPNANRGGMAHKAFDAVAPRIEADLGRRLEQLLRKHNLA